MMNEMNLYISEAKMYFDIENVDGEEEVVVETTTGYELFDKIAQYNKKDFEELFQNESVPVLFAQLKYIQLVQEQNGIKFNLKLDADDGAYGSLIFQRETLQDENAKKLEMIREIIDYDPEAESSLLRDLILKNHSLK